MNHIRKKIEVILLSAALLMVPVLTAFAAESAKRVDSAAGRAVIVQNVQGEDGSAQLIRKGGTIRLSRGIRLTEGDVLRTGRDSRVYMAVDTTMILRLEESSEAEIVKTTFGQKMTVKLKKGRMFYNVARQNDGQESLELMTNNVTIAVRGTSGILSVGNGFVQHQLYDGTVEVSDGGTTVVQVPGQMLETEIGPAQSLQESTTVRGFALQDIPASVVQEMLADENLMQRIVGALTKGDLIEKVTGLLDGTLFENILKNNTDDKVFKDTARDSKEVQREETLPPETESSTEETSSTEPSTEETSTEEPSPTEPSTEETSPTEPSTEETSATEPSTEETSSSESPTDPVYVHCDFCDKDVNINDPGATGHRICDGCGTFVCVGMPGHSLVTCLTYEGGCGEKYYECDAEESAKHELGVKTCHNCVHDAQLRKCVEEDSLHEVYGETCSACGYLVDFVCQLRIHHSIVECEKCHETYPYCKRDDHHCGE